MNELEKICIYDPAGANYLLGRELEFPITDKCERSAKVMGDDFVRLVFESTHKVVFDAFSFIRYKGQTFFLREKYIPKPKGTFKEDSGDVSTAYYSYDVKFVSVANMLDKYVCYRHVVVSGDKGGEWNEPEININGNLETMYKIIMGSIQQVAERLSDHMEFTSMLKTIPANGLNSDGTINTNKVKLTAGTKLLTFNFSGDKIANVCTTVANNFTNDDKKDTEWYITEDNGSLTLHFSKYVDEEYGVQYVSDYFSNNNGADSSAHPQKSGGLKDVDYAQEWSGITNVIVPYGSTRNMTYQAAKGIDEVTQMQSTFGKRLRLKPNTYYYVKDKDGKDVSFLTDKQGAVRNTSVDTGIEEVMFYDEIYPQGHFRVTKVETKNKRQDGEIVPEYTVAGVAIDSNGNEIQPAEGFYPIAIEEGTTLSVRFEKGLLNGREFEIANKTRKDEGRTTYSLKFTIVADGSLEDGTLIPSGNFIPREGDEFALFNMKMPEVYITAAEHELAQRVYTDLEEAVSKRPEVKCTTDPTSWDKEMALGYQFQVKSEKFNSEDTFVSRVISYSYKLTKPNDIQFNLASAIMQGTLSSMNDQIADVTHQAGGLEQRAINLSRRGWRDAAEMADMVDSLAADMMLVGNEKYQFAFTAGIEIVNSNNQTTAIKIGEGTLQHTQDPYISDYTCQGWWSHGAVTLNNGHTENGNASLVSLPDTPFYLYAVVGQNSDNISFELQDNEQDGEAYLLLGILSSAFADNGTNYRVFNRTNGYTQISGGTITTEQIQDAGRNLIIDFQSNPPRIIARNSAEIIGNIKFKASDEMTAEEQLAALGIDVSNALSAAEQAAYTNIYNGGDISVSNDSDKAIELKDAFIKLATLGCYVKFSRTKETPLPPFVNSCIMAVKKGTDVSHIYLYEDNIYAYLNWGDEYTPTEECDFYVALAEKEYIRDYLIPHSYDYIEYEMREVWTISGINVIVRTSDAIQSAMQAIANEEDARTEALAAAVSNINGGIDELQKQIDGEVSSYFYKIAPIDEDETVLTDIPPFNEWAENYNLRNGVYVLKTGARNEFVNHIGDTYTNMEEYISDTDTPLAGLSWRWCDATTVSPLPKQYITIRYTSNGSRITKQLHWHKIADSDAVKALQEAGRAQSTADHKSTIFTALPSNYSVGDMWILMEDTRVGGTLYKKGTILNSSDNSETFDYRHWSEDVKYIDEDIARQQAQQALDGLELGGENIARGTKDMELSSPSAWSKGTWRKTSYSTNIDLSDDPFSIVEQGVRITCNTTNAATQVSQDNATIPFQVGDKIIISCYVKPSIEGLQLECQPIWAYHDNTSSMAGMKRQRLTLGHAGEWQKVVFDNMGSITIANNSQSLAYFYAIGAMTEYVDICAVKVERGNKSTAWSPAPEDVDSKADAIKTIAEDAKEDAAASNAQLANMSNDSILTPQEKGSVADEWACIQKEYSQNSTNKTTAWGSATVAEWTAYNTAYTTLQTYVATLALADRATNTTIDKSTFQANFANYYSANVAFLNALAKKVAELEVAAMEIGGRNLAIYSTADGANCKKNGDYGFVQTTADTNTKFDLKIQPYLNDTYGGYALVRTDIVKVGVYKFNATLTKDCDRINIATNGSKIDTISKFYLKETIPSGTELVISLEITNITQGSFSWKNVMIAKGTKATDWTPAPEDVDAKVSALDYLKEALELDTEVAGGIVATTHIQLRDWTGEYNSDGTKKYKVNAGLSGLDDDNVLAWGGGDYEDAVTAAQNSDPENGNGTYNKKDGTEITTLLKKDGTGKIGIFKISETQAVVKTNQGEVLIDGTDNNGGVYIKDSNGIIKSAIINDSISKYEPPTPDEETLGSLTQSSYKTVYTNNSSDSTITSVTLLDSLKTRNGYTNKIKAAFGREGIYVKVTTGQVSSSYPSGTPSITLYIQLVRNGVAVKYFNTTMELYSSSGATCVFQTAIGKGTPLSLEESLNSSTEYSVVLRVVRSGGQYWGTTKIEWMGGIDVINQYYPIYTPKTVIGIDGVVAAYNLDTFFKVQNTSNGQKIFAKGLSDGANRNAGSGELYVTSSFVDAFVSFLDEFHDYVDHVRTIGSNAGNADAMQNKIEGIKNTLVDASGNRITDIIASS